MRSIAVCAALMLAPVVVLAQSGHIVLPDLSALAKQAKEATEVSLDADSLKAAGGLMGGQGQAAVSALSGLQGVYVHSFKFDKPNAYSMRDVENVIHQADVLGWKKLISVHGSNETVEIRMRSDANGGMLIVSAKPQELTIVNIVGQIDLAKLGQLQGKLGVPVLPDGSSSGSSAPGPGASSTR